MEKISPLFLLDRVKLSYLFLSGVNVCNFCLNYMYDISKKKNTPNEQFLPFCLEEVRGVSCSY